MAQIKTIDTVAGENQIDFKRRYPFVWLKNLGDTDVYISDKAGIVAEADGVVLLGAGQAAMLENYDDCVYVLGATTIEAHGQHSADSPFGDTIVAGGGGGGSATIESLKVTQNGVYTASGGVDGYSPVTVNVSPNVDTKSVTQNGIYRASADELDGYSVVTVEVPEPTPPVLVEKTITQNGVYDPEDDNADGYSMIDVEVPNKGQINPFPTGASTISLYNQNGITVTSSSIDNKGTGTLNISEAQAGFEGMVIELNVIPTHIYAVEFDYQNISVAYWEYPAYCLGWLLENTARTYYEGYNDWPENIDRDGSKHHHRAVIEATGNKIYLNFNLCGYADYQTNTAEITNLKVYDYSGTIAPVEIEALDVVQNGIYSGYFEGKAYSPVNVDVYEKYHELYTGGANMNPSYCYFNDTVNTDTYDELWIEGQYIYTENSNKNISLWSGRYPTSVLYQNNRFIGAIGGYNHQWTRPNSVGTFTQTVLAEYNYPYAFFGVKNKDRTEECLWANTGSTTPSTVTLSESIFDYDEICLYFVKGDGATTTSWYLTDELSVNDIVQGYDDTQGTPTVNKYTIASNTTLTTLSESGGYVLMGVYGVKDTSLSETTLYTNSDPTTAPATVTLSDSYANYDEIVLIGHIPSEDTICSYSYPVKILGRWRHDAYRDRIAVFSSLKSYWLTFISNTTLVADANPTIILDKIIGIKRPVIANAEPLPVKYIDDNRGIIYYDNSGVSPIGFKNTDKLENGYISMPTDTAVTVEFCGVVSTYDTYGRIWQIGTYDSVGNTFAYDNGGSSPMFELAIHNSWDTHLIDATNYLNTLITVSIVIDSDTKIYINGTLVSNVITFTKSDIVSDENVIRFLHGTTANRAADGDIYAFRIYHKALTRAEIQQNAQADIYNFGSTTVISE